MNRVTHHMHKDLSKDDKFINFIKSNQKDFSMGANEVKALENYKKMIPNPNNEYGLPDQPEMQIPENTQQSVDNIFGGSAISFLKKHKKKLGLGKEVIKALEQFDMQNGKFIDYDNNVQLHPFNNPPSCECGCSALDIAQKIGGKDVAFMIVKNKEHLKGLGFLDNLNEQFKDAKVGSGKPYKSKRKCKSCAKCSDTLEKMLVGGYLKPEQFSLMGSGWLDKFADELVWLGNKIADPLANLLPGPIGKVLTYPMKNLDKIAHTLSPDYNYKDPFGPNKSDVVNPTLPPIVQTNKYADKLSNHKIPPSAESLKAYQDSNKGQNPTGAGAVKSSTKNVSKTGALYFNTLDPNNASQPPPYVENLNSDYISYNAGMKNPLQPPPKKINNLNGGGNMSGGYKPETYIKLFMKKGKTQKQAENEYKKLEKLGTWPIAFKTSVQLYAIENNVSEEEAGRQLKKRTSKDFKKIEKEAKKQLKKAGGMSAQATKNTMIPTEAKAMTERQQVYKLMRSDHISMAEAWERVMALRKK